jgi:hypothetical protein
MMLKVISSFRSFWDHLGCDSGLAFHKDKNQKNFSSVSAIGDSDFLFNWPWLFATEALVRDVNSKIKYEFAERLSEFLIWRGSPREISPFHSLQCLYNLPQYCVDVERKTCNYSALYVFWYLGFPNISKLRRCDDKLLRRAELMKENSRVPLMFGDDNLRIFL